MKRLLLMVMLSALTSADFAQQRKTATRATTVRTSTNNKEVTQLKDSIVILNKRIDELEGKVRDLQMRLNVKPIQELKDKNGTIYRIVKCESNVEYKYVKVYFQVVNHQDKQRLKLGNSIGIQSVAIIDGNKVERPNIYSGKHSISGTITLEKDVVTNFELYYYILDDKIHRTINSLSLTESNSGTELQFREISITDNN
ncbi:MAG: hypothetical protein IJK42_07460 [Prevotella sp.]|nr:hypothetical protein [Prevotella sp.]MBQ6209592.1 hypothetical protein [Prevotella sp.]